MNYKYSKYEMETIINFNEAETFATVSTRSRHMIRKLDRLAEENPGEVIVTFSPDGYREYTISKKWIRVVRSPRCSDEDRQRRSDRMAAYHERRRSMTAEAHTDDEYLDYPPPPHTAADCPPEKYASYKDWAGYGT